MSMPDEVRNGSSLEVVLEKICLERSKEVEVILQILAKLTWVSHWKAIRPRATMILTSYGNRFGWEDRLKVSLDAKPSYPFLVCIASWIGWTPAWYFGTTLHWRRLVHGFSVQKTWAWMLPSQRGICNKSLPSIVKDSIWKITLERSRWTGMWASGLWGKMWFGCWHASEVSNLSHATATVAAAPIQRIQSASSQLSAQYLHVTQQ